LKPQSQQGFSPRATGFKKSQESTGFLPTTEVNEITEEKPCHFVGLNLLGMDYLYHADMKLEIDMENEMVIFDSPKSAP
jgi:hypothetical protein